jgi:hypothetical protein
MKVDYFYDPRATAGDALVKFRLTYAGEIDSNGSAPHKHAMRKVFHNQLKRLWQTSPNLRKEHNPRNPDGTDTGLRFEWWEWIAKQRPYDRLGYNFIPLVRRDFSVLVSLDVLFLRQGRPGYALNKGDIDNRMKTLFDALRMPSSAQEIGGNTPASDEDPFFVLLEDDDKITQLSVDTDDLLEAVNAPIPRRNDARLVITVEIHPTFRHSDTQHFN